jgi:hypothetical protein
MMHKLLVASGVVAGGLLLGGLSAAAQAVDLDGDGVADVNADAADQSGNGVADVYAVDFTFDNVADVYMYDTNENGFMDSYRVYDGHGSFVILDLNENGFEDTSEAGGVPLPVTGPGLIGPITNPDWLTNLTTWAVGQGAAPAMGPTDSDGDGYHDGIDGDPYDPYYA